MSATSDKLFRQSALERLASPEQLDRLVVVTDTKGWLALAALTGLLLAVLLWSIFGKVPHIVAGQGMLVSEGGRVYNAMAEAEGVVSSVNVKLNDRVEKGQLLVVVEQQALRQTVQSSAELHRERQAERQRVAEIQQRELSFKQSNFERQKLAQSQIIAAAERRLAYLRKMLAQREKMASTGLISKDTVEETRQKYNQVLQDSLAANNRILELEAMALDLHVQHARTLASLDQAVAEAGREARGQAAQLERFTRITAPTTGTVTEIKVAAGAVVRLGDAAASVASVGRALQVVLYLPTRDGKAVKPGMAVRVAPATVRKQEFGTLLGQVTEVSEYPATREGMLAVLQNEALVTRFSSTGAPYAARVDLLPDTGTPSGYRWTSSRGPNLQVSAGTTVSAEVTVREVAPISLFIPLLRQLAAG